MNTVCPYHNTLLVHYGALSKNSFSVDSDYLDVWMQSENLSKTHHTIHQLFTVSNSFTVRENSFYMLALQMTTNDTN